MLVDQVNIAPRQVFRMAALEGLVHDPEQDFVKLRKSLYGVGIILQFETYFLSHKIT